MSSVLDSLTKIVGAANIKTDAQSFDFYGKDWLKLFQPDPLAIVFPTSTEKVSEIVKWAIANKTALVPSGGRTGLSGGAYAGKKEVVVSFDRMGKILGFNEDDLTVHVQAGVVTEDLQNYAKERGYQYPVDFAARGSSFIGGNIATNAGGIKVVRYGMTRDWVASLKVVTGTGEILTLNNSLIKNATGYDLRHLFIGSEGILGFVTEAHMKVTKPAAASQVMLLGLDAMDSIMEVFRIFRKKSKLLAFEMLTEEANQLVLEHKKISPLLGTKSPFYVVLEVEADEGTDEHEELMGIFEELLETGKVSDGLLAQNAQQAKDIWAIREDISEACSVYTPYKNDVSVTISKVPEFLKTVDATIKGAYPDLRVIWFGHIGDGNLHINILKPDNLKKPEFIERCQKVDELLFKEIQNFEGSISAEHGLGITKKPFLKYTRSEAEIELMRGIKKVFDPHGIINPGKVL
jgi:FAD/FMN-containing dehydrogenase